MRASHLVRRRSSAFLLGVVLVLGGTVSSSQAGPPAPPAHVTGVEHATAGDGQWTDLRPGPLPRSRQAAVYDSNRGWMVMVGGRCLDSCCPNGAVPADVWILRLTSNPPQWVEVWPSGVSPAAGLGPMSIYDPIRDRMLIPASGGHLWALSLGDAFAWTDLVPSGTAPTVSAVVYDSFRDRMLVVASNGGAWELPLGGALQWNLLATTGKAPSAVASALYDPVRDRVVVFADSVRALSLAGTPTWSALAMNHAPPGHSLIYDPVGDRAIEHGGCVGGGCGTTESWSLSLSGTPAWSLLSSGGPSVAFQSAVYDPTGERMMVFGGYWSQFYADSSSGELWGLSLAGTPQWSDFTPEHPPAACGIPAVRDPVRGRMIVFDGTVQSFDLLGLPAWSTLSPGGASPTPRQDYSAIYDPVRDRLVLFGGWHLVGQTPAYLQDVWSLSLGGSLQWTQQSPSGSPPDTAGPAVYDPVGDRMLVMRGQQVWALALADPMAWSQLSPSGTPPTGLREFSAVHDPVRNRVLVFGGIDAGGLSNRTWALSLTPTPAWSELTPTGTPPSARTGPMAIYDSARDRVVISCGDTGGATSATDSWELALAPTPAWRQLAPTGSVQGGLSAVYDPPRDRMVTVGRCAASANPLCADPVPICGALWFNGVVGVPPRDGTGILALAQSRPNPARGRLLIPFSLRSAGPVTLRVYDLSGRVVRTLFDGLLPAGSHSVGWNGTRGDGSRAAPGIYFYELRAAGERMAKRLILLQ